MKGRWAAIALLSALAMAAPARADAPPPSFFDFGPDYPSVQFAASAPPCGTVINAAAGGVDPYLQTLCQGTLRLTFTRPQASVELLAKALGAVPELVATAHRTSGDPVVVRVQGPTAWKPVVLAAPGIDYVEVSAAGADVGVDHLALSESPQPDTAIASGPDPRSAATTAAFTLTSNRPDATRFTCALDGGPFGTCAALTGLAVGAHTLQAAAIDDYGAVDGSPATYAWTVLPPAPETAIDAVLYDQVGFSSPDPQATFECQADEGAWAPCTSPHRFTGLALGAHTARVRAIGAQKQWDLTPAATALTIEQDSDGDGIPDRDDPLAPGDRRPINGSTGNATLVSGEVTVKRPGDSTQIPLKGVATLPVGTVVDSTKGQVTIHVASNGYSPNDRRYRDATVTLAAGIFKIRQARMQKGLTRVVQIPVEFVMLTPPKAASVCAKRASKGVVRTLTASGKGVFRVTGKASYADGRSSAWTTTDRCDGTLTRVRHGHVKVHHGRRAVVVHQSRRYFVKARLFQARQDRAGR